MFVVAVAVDAVVAVIAAAAAIFFHVSESTKMKRSCFREGKRPTL